MDGNDLSAEEVSGLGAMQGVPTCAETANMEQVNQMIDHKVALMFKSDL